MPLTITLASRDNGVGLSTDMELLSALFTGAGHTVRTVDWRVPRIPACDVLIFLELFSPHLMRYAQRTIGIFNPEWFLESRWRQPAGKLDQIWAKSVAAASAFSTMNPRTHLTGFLSRDWHDPQVKRRTRCLHVQGHSQDKNTERVIQAWTRFKDLPPLTIVGEGSYGTPPWVRHLARVPEARMRSLMNEHTIHLCPSKVEGWGHYITEAMSVGAHVITVDASPMNEHIRPEWGTLITPSRRERRGITQACDVNPNELAGAVRRAAKMGEGERNVRSRAARQHMEHRNSSFAVQALKLLEE